MHIPHEFRSQSYRQDACSYTRLLDLKQDNVLRRVQDTHGVTRIRWTPTAERTNLRGKRQHDVDWDTSRLCKCAALLYWRPILIWFAGSPQLSSQPPSEPLLTRIPSLPSAATMSDSSLYTAGFDSYPMVEYSKQYPFDFLFQSTETLPSHPDVGEFESEIDSTLEGFEGPEHLQLLVQNSFIRPGLTSCGPPSAFTESAYESSSTRSESAYNPPSPNSGSTYSYAGSTYSSAYELDAMALDFQHGVCVDDYTTQSSINVNDSVDPTSFGPLPPTPPRSPPGPMSAAKSYPRTSYSDYAPPRRSSMTSELYPQIAFNAAPIGGHSTVSPISISTQLSQVQQPMLQARSMVDAQKADPRKKYKCSHCPRGNIPIVLLLRPQPHTWFHSFCPSLQSQDS